MYPSYKCEFTLPDICLFYFWAFRLNNEIVTVTYTMTQQALNTYPRVGMILCF